MILGVDYFDILKFLLGSEVMGNKTKEITARFRDESFVSLFFSPKLRNWSIDQRFPMIVIDCYRHDNDAAFLNQSATFIDNRQCDIDTITGIFSVIIHWA